MKNTEIITNDLTLLTEVEMKNVDGGFLINVLIAGLAVGYWLESQRMN